MPSISRAGSPGRTSSTENTTTEATISVISPMPMRFARNAVMWWGAVFRFENPPLCPTAEGRYRSGHGLFGPANLGQVGNRQRPVFPHAFKLGIPDANLGHLEQETVDG